MLLEERWFLSALFLSLDLTDEFFSDLWVPIARPEHFRRQLRNFLDDRLTTETYYDNKELGYAIMEISQTDDTFDLLNTWVHNIMLLRNPDRLAEESWSSIVFETIERAGEGFAPPEWIFETVSLLKSAQSNRRNIEDRIDGWDDEMLSPWDQKVLTVTASSIDVELSSVIDDTFAKIDLMDKYNRFLRAWEEHCGQLSHAPLVEFWEWGKQMTPQIGLSSVTLPFPGGWRFEIKNLLARFASNNI